MLIDDQRSSGFLDLTQTILPSVDGINNRESQYFNRAYEIINRLLPRLQDEEDCGIRMAFFPG
jgi:hypothetical protein